MLPTPTTQEFDHKDMELTHTNRRKTKDGKDSHSLNLADTVRMWPTPTAGCVEGGEQSERVERTVGGGYVLRKKNKPHMTYGAKLSDAILFEEKQEMLPTPRASEYKGCGPVGSKSHAHVEKKNYLCAVTKDPDMPTGSLNPDWVEWLMGYGQGYTDPDNKDSFTLGSHQGFPTEPDTARVTTENQYRKDRLKALGNSIVPQIAYHIGNAILEQEKI